MHVSAGSLVTGTNVLVPISISPTVKHAHTHLRRTNAYKLMALFK